MDVFSVIIPTQVLAPPRALSARLAHGVQAQGGAIALKAGSVNTKRCTKCRIEKPLSEFHKERSRKDGHKPSCKSCVRQYYDKNKERLVEYTKQWNKDHPDRFRSNVKRYLERHADEINEKRRERFRKMYAENPEKWNERSRRYHAEHLEKKYYKTWRKRNPEKVYAIKANRRALRNGGKVTAEEWAEIRATYDNKCLCCGSDEVTMDHIIPLSRGGKHSPDNIQPLCNVCNARKGTKTIDYRPAGLIKHLRQSVPGPAALCFKQWGV